MPVKYTDVKVLTVPLLPGKLGEERVIKIVKGLYRAEHVLQGRKEANMELHVIDLNLAADTGKEDVFRMVCPTIMQNELNKQYPGEKYVGKSFRCTIWAKENGQKAAKVNLIEVKIEK